MSRFAWILVLLLLCTGSWVAWQFSADWQLQAAAQELAAQQQAQRTQSDAPTKAEEEIPPARTAYLGRRIAQTMHYTGAPWLTRESRQREEDCKTMLKALGVKEGMTVCDMGCGNGFYTLQLADMVGDEGRVLAVDIQPEMLTLLKERATDEQLKRMKLILGTVIDPYLPKGEVDLILCVDVYHEFSHPELMLRRMRESLSEDGRLALVEFRLEDRQVPIKLLHKMSKKQMNKEMEANGFMLDEEFDKLPWQHLNFYKKNPDWTPPEEK